MNPGTIIIARRHDGAVVPAIVHSVIEGGVLARQLIIADSAPFFACGAECAPIKDAYAAVGEMPELRATVEALLRELAEVTRPASPAIEPSQPGESQLAAALAASGEGAPSPEVAIAPADDSTSPPDTSSVTPAP